MSNPTASNIHRAVQDLHAGRITPEQYRAIMRASRETHGEDAHLHAHDLAIAAFARRNA